MTPLNSLVFLGHLIWIVFAFYDTFEARFRYDDMTEHLNLLRIVSTSVEMIDFMTKSKELKAIYSSMHQIISIVHAKEGMLGISSREMYSCILTYCGYIRVEILKTVRKFIVFKGWGCEG